MILAIAEVYAQIPQRDAARDVMARAQQRARQEPGCLSFTFAETIEEPGRFLLVERWRDQAALDEHFGSNAFADYQAEITPLLARDSKLEVHVVGEGVRPVDSSPLDLRQDD
jgi:quinol monooxygenase YgiN